MTDSSDEVVVRRDGRLGHILLNRPKAMNALTHGMVVTIAAVLADWATDDSVETVLISGAGERGLCAGGDIVAIYRQVQAGGNEAARFWADEYALNELISRYPKPYVAFMDGLVLGGGVGVSAHGSVRIVTERTRIGMPEVGIGFVPDVGGTFLLSRAPGELGTHLGLTGGMGSGADAVALGLADFFVPSESLDALAAALATEPAVDAVARFAQEAPASPLEAERAWIDDCYSSDDALEILNRLDASTAAARETAAIIRAKSPLAVSTTLASLRRASAIDTLAEVLNQEYRVSVRFAEGSEIIEGIRAQVIDKDRNPKWNPATLDDVEKADVDAFFAPLVGRELGLSQPTTPGN
jgi:enoyl-CoA hydratase